MRKAVAFGLLFVVLVMTFGVSGVALADRSLSVEHSTPFASTPNTDTGTDDDRTISGERIDGDVEAAGDIVVTDGSWIKGDVEAEGDATIIDSRVDGDVEADGHVVIEADSRILGDVEAEGDAAVIDSRVDGDVEAGGSVRITAAIINEDIDAEGTVELTDGSRIKGDVDAGADVIISKYSQVDGEIDADGNVIDEDEQAAPELSDLNIAGQGAEATIMEGDDEDVSVVVENVGDAPSSFDITLKIGEETENQQTEELAPAEAGRVSFETVTGDLAPAEYDVTASMVDDDLSGVLQVEAADDDDDRDEDDNEAAEAVSVLPDLDIAGQGADATITEGTSEGLSVEVENVGDAPGSFDVTLAIGDTLGVTENTDELAAGETETVTFPDVTGGLVADGYTVDVSTVNDTATGTLEIQTDEQENGSDEDEQENGSDDDEQESDSDDEDREDGGDEDEQESGGDEDEREGTLEILTASLSNTVITAGESLQIGLLVENVADGDDTFDADLLVDGETVDSASVTIEAGGTETIAFSYQFDDPGEYEIAVGDWPLDTVTVTPADEDGYEMERSGDDATAIEIVQATVPADWVREGYETSVRVTVENTANRTANRTLTVTIDDQPVANETVTLQPHERDEVTIEFEATAGSVAVEDVDAGWIDTSVTDAEDDSEEEATEEGAGFGFEVGIAAFLVIVGTLAGVAVLKPLVIADST